MTKWRSVLHRDLRHEKPSTKPLVQKAIARNLVRDYGLSSKQAQKFSEIRRRITIKRPAIGVGVTGLIKLRDIAIPKGTPTGALTRRAGRKITTGLGKLQASVKGAIHGTEKLRIEKLRARLRPRFRPTRIVTDVRRIVPRKMR